LKHPDLFINSDLLDISWHKGLYDSNLLIGYRYPKPLCLGQHSLTIQVNSVTFWIKLIVNS
jgi:hypothetical protein